MDDKRPGFKVDGYFVTFPEGDIIEEAEDGQLSVALDVYKIDNGKYIRQKELHEDLELKIAAYINEMLTRAIEEEEKKKQHVKD
jgi:hypothetical protein